MCHPSVLALGSVMGRRDKVPDRVCLQGADSLTAVVVGRQREETSKTTTNQSIYRAASASGKVGRGFFIWGSLNPQG